MERIRLGYNVPVELDSDGSLCFRFQNGRMVESAPVAWQQVGGRWEVVEVAYRLLGEGPPPCP